MAEAFIYYAVAAASAASQYQQGQTQAKLYSLQAEQASIEGRRKQLQYEDQANKVTNQLAMTNAAVAARAYSGGVSAMSGSGMSLSALNNTRAGREWMNSVEAGKMAASMGEAQAGVLQASGKAAKQAGTIGALTTLAMAGATGYSMGTTPNAAAAATGVKSVPFSFSNMMGNTSRALMNTLPTFGKP